ncbi:MAG: RsbRD N-terminal domain-containing protein, partial [Syntrophales bacterium LBB04]|nr:RsbRD N-terminal domain-containing protein [Syntrophales bacterium LBB04]
MADTQSLLKTNKDAIIKRWSDLILDTYPADAARFFKRENDPFANPVGAAVIEETANIYQELLAGPDLKKLHASLDRIIRIRAVQDFSPADALSFIFLLKKAARDEVRAQGIEAGAVPDLFEFECRIDRAALFGFEIYVGCKEQIYR